MDLSLEVNAPTVSDAPQETDWDIRCSYRLQAPSQTLLAKANRIGGGTLNIQAQHALIACVHDEICQEYPPRPEYTLRILKRALSLAEMEGQLVADELYEAHCELMAKPSASPKLDEIEWDYKTLAYTPLKDTDTQMSLDTPEKLISARQLSRSEGFPSITTPPDSNSYNPDPTDSLLITLRLSPNCFAGGTGCHDWDAGVFLAELVVSYPGLFRGKRVMELGAGSGLAGVCLSRLNQGQQVILSDGDHDTLGNLRYNLSVNKVALSPERDCTRSSEATAEAAREGRLWPEDNRVQLLPLVWEDWSHAQLQALGAQVIIGGDIVYDPVLVKPLIHALGGLLTPSDLDEGVERELPYAVICTTLRQESTLQLCLDAAREAGLEVVDYTNELFPTNFFHHQNSLRREDIHVHVFRYDPLSQVNSDDEPEDISS